MSEQSPDQPSAYGQPIGWALYLGISWTWVIGMFLPVLLIPVYGLYAWFIFAVPNCLGAAAMGWVMRSASHSRQITFTHRSICELFSYVTIAFHVYVALWILPGLLGVGWWVIPLVLIQLAFMPVRTGKHIFMWAALTLLISVSAGSYMQSKGLFSLPVAEHDWVSLGSLSVVCVFGFLTNPYLDLTFHLARQNTTEQGAKFAFGAGFCVIFLSMIVMTLLYASRFRLVSEIAAYALAAHFACQMIFTVNAHGLAVGSSAARDDRTGMHKVILGFSLAVALVMWLMSNVISSRDLTYHGMDIAEVGYRAFLSFYGLAFPAYVWINMCTGRTDRYAMLIWVGTVGIASPFYWIAFMDQKMVYVLPGVAIVLLARLLLQKRNGESVNQIEAVQ